MMVDVRENIKNVSEDKIRVKSKIIVKVRLIKRPHEIEIW